MSDFSHEKNFQEFREKNVHTVQECLLCSNKYTNVFLLPLGWDASPSQWLVPALNSSVPISTLGWREAL